MMGEVLALAKKFLREITLLERISGSSSSKKHVCPQRLSTLL